MTARELAESRMFLQVADVELIQKAVGMLAAEEPWIADLGAGSGTTAAAVFEANRNAKIWTIDISTENLNWAEAIVLSMGMTDYWVALCMDSVQAAEFLSESAWDLVMIDTSHEYEHTKDELNAWIPRLNPGGYVWLHDYIGYDGVKKAVDEFVETRRVNIIEQSGLGILVKPL